MATTISVLVLVHPGASKAQEIFQAFKVFTHAAHGILTAGNNLTGLMHRDILDETDRKIGFWEYNDDIAPAALDGM